MNISHPVNVITATPMWRASGVVARHTVAVAAVDNPLVERARAVAADLLGEDAALSEHSARAAVRAADLARRIRGARPSEVIAAAWLHDIGYVSALRRTGFHPLDGALFLIAHDWPERVVRLVGHHSSAALEAPFYGVGHHLRVIEPVPGIDADILTSADLTSGPGDPVPRVEDRLSAMRLADEERGIVPADVREERYDALLAAHARVLAAL